MSDTLKVIFDSMDPSEALEDKIRQRFDKLQRHFEDILSCDVRISADERGQRQGGSYRVTINLNVPNRQFVVSHDPGDSQQHDDAYVAARDALDALQRQMEDHVRKVRDSQRH